MHTSVYTRQSGYGQRLQLGMITCFKGLRDLARWYCQSMIVNVYQLQICRTLQNPGYLWLRATTVDDISVALSQVHCLKVSIKKYRKLKSAGPVQDGIWMNWYTISHIHCCCMNEAVGLCCYCKIGWSQVWGPSNWHQMSSKCIFASFCYNNFCKSPSPLLRDCATGPHRGSVARSVGTSGLEPRCQSLMGKSSPCPLACEINQNQWQSTIIQYVINTN